MSSNSLWPDASPEWIVKVKRAQAGNKLKAFAQNDPSLARTPEQAAGYVGANLIASTGHPKDTKLTDVELAKIWRDNLRKKEGLPPLDT